MGNQPRGDLQDTGGSPLLTSYSMNLAESSRIISSLLGGVSRVARARQRRVSRPVPHSLMTDMIFSFTGPVSGTRVVPTRT